MGKFTKKMFYVGFCRVCETGPLGLRTCGQCESVSLLCDECDAVWTSANLDTPPAFSEKSDLPCPACGYSLLAPPSRWSTTEEVQSTSWVTEAVEQGQLEIKEGEAFPPDASPNEPQEDLEP